MIDSRFAIGSMLAAALGGCGLISSDVTNFNLDLPDKNFTIDAAGWQVDADQAAVLTQTSCASNPSICASAADAACAMDCTGRCGAQDTCELDLDVGLYQSIDLVTEKPELQSLNDEPIIKVTIDSVRFEVPSNTLTLATPEMKVYVAPMSVMDPTDPQAKLIGVIPAVPPGATTGSEELQFTATGRADLVAIMSTFKTPFNLIVGSTLTLTSTTPAPMGRLDAVVHIKAHAGL